MTTIDDPSKPLWQVFINEPPKELFIVYYKGNSGRWIFSSTYFKEEVALEMASKIHHPTYILKYDLVSKQKVMRPLMIRLPLEE